MNTPTNRLDLPRTREEITAWVLSMPHIKFSLVNTTLDNLSKSRYARTTQDRAVIEIIAWANAIRKEFPDLYSTVTDPILPFRYTVNIGNIPIYHRHKNDQEHKCK